MSNIDNPGSSLSAVTIALVNLSAPSYDSGIMAFGSSMLPLNRIGIDLYPHESHILTKLTTFRTYASPSAAKSPRLSQNLTIFSPTRLPYASSRRTVASSLMP